MMPKPGEGNSNNSHQVYNSKKKSMKANPNYHYKETLYNQNIAMQPRMNLKNSTMPSGNSEKPLHLPPKSEYRSTPAQANLSSNYIAPTSHGRFSLPYGPPPHATCTRLFFSSHIANFPLSYKNDGTSSYNSCNCPECCSNMIVRNDGSYNSQTNSSAPIAYPNYNTHPFYENVYHNQSTPPLVDVERYRYPYRPQIGEHPLNRTAPMFPSYRDHEYQQPPYFPINSYKYNKDEINTYDKKMYPPYYNNMPDYYRTAPFFPLSRAPYPQYSDQRAFENDDYFSKSQAYKHLNDSFSSNHANTIIKTPMEETTKKELSVYSNDSSASRIEESRASLAMTSDKSNHISQSPTRVNLSICSVQSEIAQTMQYSDNNDTESANENTRSTSNESAEFLTSGNNIYLPVGHVLESIEIKPKEFSTITRDEYDCIIKMEVFRKYFKTYASSFNKDSEITINSVKDTLVQLNSNIQSPLTKPICDLIYKHSKLCAENVHQITKISHLVDNFSTDSMHFHDIKHLTDFNEVMDNSTT